MFLNLYFVTDPAFRDHNFSDFWNYGGGGDPIGRISAECITGYIRASYAPDPKRPGRLEGFPPDFDPILPLTFSQPCCDAFIRSTTLPVTPRDYYLSKLFQFVYSILLSRSGSDLPELDVRLRLQELLDLIPDEFLPPDQKIRWIDVWWDIYEDARSRSIEAVLGSMEERITRMLKNAREKKKRSPGPRPENDHHRMVARVVRQIEHSTGEWHEQLPRVCSALDRARVPSVLGRARDTPTTWLKKLVAPGGKERVKKDIEYRLKQNAKAGPSD